MQLMPVFIDLCICHKLFLECHYSKCIPFFVVLEKEIPFRNEFSTWCHKFNRLFVKHNKKTSCPVFRKHNRVGEKKKYPLAFIFSIHCSEKLRRFSTFLNNQQIFLEWALLTAFKFQMYYTKQWQTEFHLCTLVNVNLADAKYPINAIYENRKKTFNARPKNGRGKEWCLQRGGECFTRKCSFFSFRRIFGDIFVYCTWPDYANNCKSTVIN